ncbi:MAG: DUF5684 domain-containing protein [Phycisphaerales bacterium]|nr:DUF5684 domain-containing protein [Phycisphaerales bacterium]
MTPILHTQDGESPQGPDDQMNSPDDAGMNTMSMESEPSVAPPQDDLPVVQAGLLEVLVVLLAVAFWVLFIAGLWKSFNKANIPGILSIIPIVKLFFIAKLAGKPAWWGVLLLIPVINFVVAIIMCMGVSERFNRGLGTTLGLFFLTPIFYLILGFGSAQWTPPPAEN